MNQPQPIQSLESIGLIGNCQISALTDGSGGIAWLCLPQPDGPSVFATLLDPRAGHFTIAPPSEIRSRVESCSYLVNTNVIRTVFETDRGAFEVIDFCPRFQLNERIFRPPQLFRIVRPLRGIPLVQVSCSPKWSYGQHESTLGFGSHHITYSHANEMLRLSTTAPLTYIREERPFLLKEPHYFVLAYGSPFEAEIGATSESFLSRTIHHWRAWVRSCALPEKHGDEVIRSALCLKLHVYEDTGAILAATTTSLPESPGQGRNWDYRYCWLRDAYFEIDALSQLGQTSEIEGFVDYLSNIVSRSPSDPLQPVYRISGSPVLEEFELSHIQGFQNEKPVRIGNAAAHHIQNDVYGELILALAPLLTDPRFSDRDDRPLFDQIEWLAQRCIDLGSTPDAGLWEFRSKQRRHTFTQFMSVAGLRCASQIAKELKRVPQCELWQSASRHLWSQTVNACLESPIGFPQALEPPWTIDASSLALCSLPLMEGADAETTAKVRTLFKQTIQTVENRLLTPTGVRRYEGPDDFGSVNSCFGLCTFWYIDALITEGRTQEANRWFDQVLGYRNKLGLLSEDWSIDKGMLRGNFPQVYSHVGLIRTAMRI